MPIIRDVERFCDALESTSFFQDFEREELERLVGACDRKILAPREALWAVGSRGDSAYILIDGGLEETRRLPPDGQRIEQIRDLGEVVALSYLVQGWTHAGTVAAKERTELLRLDREAFHEMLEREDTAAFRLVDKIAEALVKEMRDANRRLHEVFGNPAETLRTLRRRVRGT